MSPLLALALLASLPCAAAAQSHARVESVAQMLERLVVRGDPAAVEYVVKALQRGLPPDVLEPVLDAIAAHPHPEYRAALQRFTRYRKAGVRARAIVALTRYGRTDAEAAILIAFADPFVRVRLLGMRLLSRYTTPKLEEASIELLANDPELVALLQAEDPSHGS
jgi:HEAT repeat protein